MQNNKPDTTGKPAKLLNRNAAAGKRRLCFGAAAAAGLSIALLLVGCATEFHLPAPASSFEEYVAQTHSFIAANRRFATADHQTEIDRASPWEIRPQKPDGRAVLCIHGLSDSPWTFRDTGAKLAEDGVLVRSILIPGHGTKPEDMLGLTGADWIEAAWRELLRLKSEGYRVWVAGFSTGGNIALTLAAQTQVEGLLLFSPAPYIRSNLVYLVPAASLFFDWLRTPEEAGGGTSPVRYRTVPMSGLNAFYDTMREAQGYLNTPTERLKKTPAFLVLSEFDSIVDTQDVFKAADEVFANPKSRVLWYGDASPERERIRVIFRTSNLPAEHIRSFSHLGINFSPENDYYGKAGRRHRCESGESVGYLRCELPDDALWYGAWGEKRGDKPFVRLTYNPYFEEQSKRLVDFLRETDSTHAAERTTK